MPLDVPSAEVCAVAKKDLAPGERLDAPRAAWLLEQRRLWPGQIADTVRVVA